jgi:hypothetical protein
MTTQRAQAYRQVLNTLNEIGPSKLLRSEQDLIREAADTLLFSHDLLEDDAAREALEDVQRLCRGLVESGRWIEPTATQLVDDVAACGPTHAPALEAA